MSLAALAFLSASAFAVIGVDLLHDGVMLKPALDLASGKALFRETFYQYGAFTAVLQALALKVFGARLIVIKLQAAFCYSLTVYLLWLVWTRFVPRWTATLCGVISIFMAAYFFNHFNQSSPHFGWWFQPWSSVYSLFFTVLALYLLIRSLEAVPERYAAASGVSASLALWCRQSAGGLLLLAIAFFLLFMAAADRRARRAYLRRFSMFLAGAVAVTSLFLLWLFLNGAVKDMWLQSVIFPMNWAGGKARGIPLPGILDALFPFYRNYWEQPSLVWIALPAAGLLVFFRAARDLLRGPPSTRAKAAVLAAAAVGLSSWAQYYPVPCERHIYWAAVALTGLFAYFVRELLRKSPAFYRNAGTAAALALLFAPDVTARLREGGIKLSRDYVLLQTPEVLRGMKVPPHDALFFGAVESEINDYFTARPGGALLNYSQDPLYAAFAPGPGGIPPFYMHWTELEKLYPDHQARLSAYAAAVRPLIFSNNVPVVGKRYIVKLAGRNLFVTAPAGDKAPWGVVNILFSSHTLSDAVDAPASLLLELKSFSGTAGAIRALEVSAVGFDGERKGAWRPSGRRNGVVLLSYSNTGRTGGPREIAVPAQGSVKLLLTGHDFPRSYYGLKLQVSAEMRGRGAHRQSISLPPLFGRTFEALLALSSRRYTAGDITGAIQAAEEALLLRPEHAPTYANLCLAWGRLGKWKKAVEAG
ncbi:MAG: hypothetical protein COT18_08185, partial [Elusimicrobia bacterium CG08_land_8_20_14_0_20_59_10]